MSGDERMRLIQEIRIAIGQADNRRAFVLVNVGIMMDALALIEEMDPTAAWRAEHVKET